MKSKDRFPAWPEQIGFMRAQACCTFLEPLLDRGLYLQVRAAVFKWDVATAEKAETLPRVVSDETRAKMAAARLGRKFPRVA